MNIVKPQWLRRTEKFRAVLKRVASHDNLSTLPDAIIGERELLVRSRSAKT